MSISEIFNTTPEHDIQIPGNHHQYSYKNMNEWKNTMQSM